MIFQAESDADLARCFPVIRELRPHLADEAAFIEQVRRQGAHGYRVAAVEQGGEVVAVAGWRITECLSSGRFVYVDDLVTRASERSRGHGSALLEWLVEQARLAGCKQFQLDSGVQRYGAHRFYLTHRMDITCHHLALVLE